MRVFVLLFLCIAAAQLSEAQNNIVYLMGKGRHYGDSAVLRWNAEDVFSFSQLMNSTVVIERKTPEDANYRMLARQKATAVQSWQITQQTRNNLLITAAASLQQLSAQATGNPADVATQMAMMADKNFFWANVSLAADLDPHIADLCNLRFADHGTKDLPSLAYKIYLEGNGYTSDTLFIILEGGNMAYRSDVSNLAATEKESEVRLQWSADKTYSGYYVQSSPRPEGPFATLSKSPMVIPAQQGETPTLFYSDSVDNYKPKYYRIFAIDLFGDTALISKPLLAMGRDRTAPPMASGFKVTETNGKLLLSWDPVDGSFGEKGIALGVRHFDEAPFEPLHKTLLPLSTKTFAYTPEAKQNDYYFILQLFDTAGNSSRAEVFYQLMDNNPPAKPEKLKATVDTNGIVTLRWKRNAEKDLKGYLIYFSNSEATEFSGIVNTPYNDTVFYDTLSLRMLNREVFYRIVAADHRFNLSPSSDVVKVLRPDTLRPVSPLITDYRISDTAIFLKWTPSSSADVLEHRLFRQEIKTGKVVSFILKPADTLFCDRQILAGSTYAYNISARDESGNVSPPSRSLLLKTYRNMHLPPVKIFVAIYDSATNTVNIQWQHPYPKVKKIVLYRGTDKDAVMPLPAVLSAGALMYKDTRINRAAVYFYAIRIYLEDGSETMMNLPVGVKTF